MIVYKCLLRYKFDKRDFKKMTDMQKESTLEFFARKNTKLEISEADGNTRGIFSKMEPLDQSRRVGTYEIAT